MRILLGLAVSAALLSVACTGDDGAPAVAPSSTPSPSETPSTSATPAVERLTLGPDGVGALRLGMSPRQVAATGLATSRQGSPHDGWARGCHRLEYADDLGRVPGGSLNGAVSVRQGLEQMYATRRMETPEGIHLGSTILDVRAAYDRPGTTSGDLVVVPASPDAVYRIQLGGVVTSIALELRRRECGI